MANTTSDKLNRLNQTKQGIKAFLISEGQTVGNNDTFYSYISKLQATHKNLGLKEITQNGEYSPTADNLDGYNALKVNVLPNLGNKIITAPGIYLAEDDGFEGFYRVAVSVTPGGGPANVKAKNIVLNGTYLAANEGVDGFSEIYVNVPITGTATSANDLIRQIDLGGALAGNTRFTEQDYNDENVEIMLGLLESLANDPVL